MHFQAMLFMNFSNEIAESFKSKYRDVAEQFKGEGISFLLGDIEASQGAFQVGIPNHGHLCCMQVAHFLSIDKFYVGCCE